MIENQACFRAFVIGVLLWTIQGAAVRRLPSRPSRVGLDPSSPVVTGAVISDRQEQTGARRVVETNSDGAYQLEGLDAGD